MLPWGFKITLLHIGRLRKKLVLSRGLLLGEAEPEAVPVCVGFSPSLFHWILIASQFVYKPSRGQLLGK